MSEAVTSGTDWVQECLLEEGVLGEKGLESPGPAKSFTNAGHS